MILYDEKGNEVNLVDFVALNHRNLLVNGDFQVNQRGLSEYRGTNGVYKPTLDKWKIQCHETTCVLKVNSNNTITISNTGNYNAYFMQGTERINGKCVGVTNIIDVSGDVKFYLTGNSNTKKSCTIGINKIVADGTFVDGVAFHIPPNSNITIEYIDLFEGDVAYPHVKKSYSEDLMECQRYLQIIEKVTIMRYEYKTGFGYYPSLTFPKMKGTPQVKVSTIDNLTQLNAHNVTDSSIAYLSGKGDALTVSFSFELSCE